MKFLRILVLLMLIYVVACKKNDVNPSKFKNTKISPEILTPLANAKIIAADLLKQDSIIQYDPDGLIRITFKQDSVFNLDADEIFKDLRLGKSSTKFSIGALNIIGNENKSNISLDDITVEASLDDRNYLTSSNGKKNIFKALNSKKTDITNLDKDKDFEFLKISNGHLLFSVYNGYPTELTNLQISIFDSATQTNPVLLGTVKFVNILPKSSAFDSIDISGRVLSNSLGFNVPSVNLAQSADSVFINMEDNLEITTTFSNLTCIGGKAVLPAQKIETKNLSIDLSNPNLAAKLKNIEFNDALLPINTTSTLNSNIIIDLSLPDATKNNNPINSLRINATKTTTKSNLDLSGTQIHLGYDPEKEYNMLRISVSTDIQSSIGLVEFDSSDYIEFEFDAQPATFEYLDGYLGQDTFDITIDNLDISQLAELGRGIKMNDPKMKIYLKNSVGIPILVELDILSKDANGNELSMNVQDMNFPFPTISERGTIKSETFEINKSNSAIVECLGMPAVLFDIKGRAIMNPDGFIGFTNHITRNSAIDLGFDTDIPMIFSAQNFIYVDTLDQGKSLQGLADFDLLELKIKTKNGFPLGGTLDLIFTDSSYKVIDSLTEVTLIQSAIVDKDGKITETSENMSTFLMPGAMLDKLDARKCQYIFIRTNFNSYDNGNVPVSIYTSCALDISLAFRAIYTTEL